MNYLDSLDLVNNYNSLLDEEYLIDNSLKNYLLNSWETNLSNKFLISRDINKKKGIYLVVFNVLKMKKENVIIYNYIKYNDVFINCLCAYLLIEQHSSLRFNDNNLGNNYFFVLDKDIINLYEISSLNFLEKYSYKYDIKLKNLYENNNKLPPLSIVDLFKEIENGKLLIKNNKEISNIINSIIKIKNLKDISNSTSNLELDNLNSILKNNFHYKKTYNLLNKFIFVVSDLENLKDEIKNLGHNSINAGPNKYRGSINSMNHILINIDRDFRNSMYRHNLKFNEIKERITKDKFSFANIHINMGNIRW